MNRETVVEALHATTVADDQKKAGEYLDKCQSPRPRLRTTTSTESNDWLNLSSLLTDRECPSPLPDESEEERRQRVDQLMKRWKLAARRARRAQNDPWISFRINDLPVSRAKRLRYSSIRKTWTEDFVEVKLHPEPFARGAMRECYRMKKLSSLVRNEDWTHAQNYVAKKYIQEVDKNVLLEDVKLQMDAKLWAEEFNRYDPPKKIDIMQMCILEMIDLPGQPLFHLEHFIEGDYVKYNSNSGFISEVARKTPQAFTHFTFERSGHQMMIVDIQDLYTDPQIHTVNGSDYGDGNLGTRGMALFFHTHLCNEICHSLCLTDFDLSDSERLAIQEGNIVVNQTVGPATTFIHQQPSACSSIVPQLCDEDAMECLRQRTITLRSRSASTVTSRSESPSHDEDCTCEDCIKEIANSSSIMDFEEEMDDSTVFTSPPRKVAFHTLSTERKRYDSMSSSIGSSSVGSSSRLTRDTEREEYWNVARKQSIPAGVLTVLDQQKLAEAHRVTQHASTLGQIHLDLARYHELGRFLPEENNEEKKLALGETIDHEQSRRPGGKVMYDKEAALYHLDVSRRCGVLEAVITVLAKIDGFAPELLQIACEATYPPVVRQAAVIYFKNCIIKCWEEQAEENGEAGEAVEYKLGQRDRQLVMDNILEAVCVAGDSTRPQLCVAAQCMMRTAFPEKWPGLLPAIKVKLATPDANALLGALLILYRMAKIYEYKRSKERKPLIDTMKELLPVLQHHFAQLESNPSQESVTLQKIILKTFHALIQFSLNLEMITTGMDCWINFCQNVLLRPIPPEVDQIEDREEKTHTVWWKCKKWAAKILVRIFERYGAPGQVESGYTEYANHFLQNFSIPCVEVMTQLLTQNKNETFVLYLALSFLNTAVSHSHTWKVLKPHAQEMVTEILFPFLCHTDADEEMWEDDAEEYVRFKYDIFEDMHNPAYGAGSLLTALSKRKDIVHPILAFAVGKLNNPPGPREVDGALRMIGELAQQLVKSKKYKKDVEKLLDTHVITRLTDQARYIRARAAWTMKQYSCAQFNNKKILKKAVEALIGILCNDQEELPGSVESALALQCLLEDQERGLVLNIFKLFLVRDMIQPHIAQIIPKILDLVARSQIEDVVSVMDDIMEQYMEDVIPIAANITEQLANMFLQIMSSDVADDRTPALMSIISTLSTILEVVCEHREIMVKMEVSVLKIIDQVFSTSNIDFYDEVLLLIQSLIMNYVSEPMWKVFDMLYHIVKNDNCITIVFSDVVPALHLYVVTDTESFLARPERLNAIIDMCKTVLENPEGGDEDQLHAAKMLEILLLQCQGMINEAIPAILLIALERLTKPFEDGISELQHMLLLVVVAALYTNTELSIRVLKELAPNHPNPLDYVTEQLSNLGSKFEGVHNRRMAILAWCTLIQLPADFRPSLVAYDPKKIIQNFLSVFHGLERALKAQAENKKADDSDSEEDSDDEDDHRNINDDLSDNEDEIDESTLHYLETLNKEQKKINGASLTDDEDDDDDTLFEEETDTEQFSTLMDGETGPDVFVIFKTTLQNFQNTDGMLFQQMIGNLSEEEKKKLHDLDQECDNHIKAEESKKLKEAGGFSFSDDAVLPGSFNFGA